MKFSQIFDNQFKFKNRHGFWIATQETTDAVPVYEGNACSNKYPVERLFREAKILEII